MLFEEKKITLKDGRTGTLRSVEVRDAQNMIEYLRIVSSQTPFLLRNEDEVTYTVEAEEQLLENKRNTPREIMMVAEVEGRILEYGYWFCNDGVCLLPGKRNEI